MGGSQGKAAAAPPPQDKPKGFTVRMSPAVAQQVQAAAAQSAPAAGGGAASNEAAYEEAFKQGYEYAVQQFMQQQQAQAQSGFSDQQLASLQQNNEEYERMVREKTESLRAREYRAPVKALACKEERQAALECYKATREGSAGEVARACQRIVDDLDLCATRVREAAMVKIVAGSIERAPGKGE